MNGVALARTVRAQNREIAIVFLTGYADYIADGYDVEALHYLLKPITREKLFPVLDRAVEHLRRNERALLIASQGETVRIPLYEIRYVESRLNYVTVHAAREYRFKTVSYTHLDVYKRQVIWRVPWKPKRTPLSKISSRPRWWNFWIKDSSELRCGKS